VTKKIKRGGGEEEPKIPVHKEKRSTRGGERRSFVHPDKVKKKTWKKGGGNEYESGPQ